MCFLIKRKGGNINEKRWHSCGKIGLEICNDKQGEAAGNITCHVNKINVYIDTSIDATEQQKKKVKQ